MYNSLNELEHRVLEGLDQVGMGVSDFGTC